MSVFGLFPVICHTLKLSLISQKWKSHLSTHSSSRCRWCSWRGGCCWSWTPCTPRTPAGGSGSGGWWWGCWWRSGDASSRSCRLSVSRSSTTSPAASVCLWIGKKKGGCKRWKEFGNGTCVRECYGGSEGRCTRKERSERKQENDEHINERKKNNRERLPVNEWWLREHWKIIN